MKKEKTHQVPLICVYCKGPIPSDAVFCCRCGKRLGIVPLDAEGRSQVEEFVRSAFAVDSADLLMGLLRDGAYALPSSPSWRSSF